MTSTTLRGVAATASALALALLVSGCSGNPSYSYSESIEVPSELTPAGTELTVGDGARLLNGPDSPVAFAVRDVIYGDASFFDEFGNGDEFLDYTPAFVIVEQQVLYTIADTSLVIPFADLLMLMDDGTEPESIRVADFRGPACPVDLPRYRSEVGKDLRCTAYLLPEGRTLATLGWHDPTFQPDLLAPLEGRESKVNSYADSPVVWRIPAETTELG